MPTPFPRQGVQLFPEVDAERLVPVDYLVDLDRDGLGPIPSASRDFVMACHVIEHLANPRRFIQECLRVIRPGGLFVIAALARFYLDRVQPLTPLRTLKRFYTEGRPPVGPQDYRDIIEYVQLVMAGLPPIKIEEELNRFTSEERT